ncbi:MAG: WS/DGAT domain-containing protein [Acidimicrobiia bacterium]|nr:WS/DGAT domain-containing protein [Acidimicrobiia bacterium]
MAGRALVGGAHLATHPAEIPAVGREAARLAASIRRQVLVAGRGRSRLLTSRSVRRRFEVRSYALAPAKSAAHALGGSVNDLFVAAVGGALGLYHDRMGHPCDALRMGMPVNLRERDDDGVGVANRFGPVRVVVPVSPKDPSARFHAVRDCLAATRNEPALGIVEELAGLVSGLPTSALVALTRSQARTIDFITSNLRGSPVPLYLAGRRILASYPFGPRTASAVNVTLMSLVDEMHLGINLDPAAFTDVTLLLDCLDESFGALLDLGL